MVELLATKLDGAGAIRTVDPRAIPPCALPSEGRVLAARFGAGRYLVGTIVEAGGRIRASATLYDSDDAVVASVDAAAENEGEIFELVDELARQLLAAQGVSRGTRLTRLAALTTDSLDALKAYLRGERDLRAGRYFNAMEGFQTAVDADPSFALAYYRLAAAAAGCALPDLARDVADRGFEHRQRLSSHDELVFLAQRAWLHGMVDDAESLYNTITGIYPDDVEAWFHLGDLLFHANPLRGRSAAEARGPFERVISLDPDHVAAMVHLVRISAIEGRTGEMLDLIDRVLRVSPEGDQALAMRALRAYSQRDSAAMARVSDELQRARAITVAIAFSDVALYAGNLEGAERLARSFIQVARSAELRALCHILVACLALAQGRQSDAKAELATATTLDSTWGLEMQALFATLPLHLDAGERDPRRSGTPWLAGTPAAAPPSTFVVFAMHNELHPSIRAWLLGLLDLRLGDKESAQRWAAELEGLEASGGGLTRCVLAELRAAIARAEGRPGEGLAILEATRPELWFQLTVASPFFSLASSRFLHAELLRELGRHREAAGWYRAMAERSPYELIYDEGELRYGEGEWTQSPSPSPFTVFHRSPSSPGTGPPPRHPSVRWIRSRPAPPRVELDVERLEVLLEVDPALGPEDRDDIVALRQHPGERQLRCACISSGGPAPRLVPPDPDSSGSSLPGTGQVAAVVVGREIGGRLEPASEKPAAQRAVGDESDAELPAGGQHVVLGVPGPEGILGLEGGDRMLHDRAPDRR